MSANMNNNSAILSLGIIYDEGKYIDVDIAKSIKYYMLSFQIHNETDFSIFTNVNSSRSCAISCNNLGLIYALNTQYQDKQLALSFLGKAAAAEYPFGQNNYALYRELFLHNDDDVEYYYKKASESGFALSFFNLGRMIELKNHKIDDSIYYYTKASDYEDNPLIFKGKEIHDERYEISKTFIICLTNLRLTLYYLNSEIIDYENAKIFFIKAFKNLINRYNQELLFVVDNEYNCSVYSYIVNFILGFPLFKMSKINLDEIIKPKRCDLKIDKHLLISKKVQLTYENDDELFPNQIIKTTDELFDFAMKNSKSFIKSLYVVVNLMSSYLYTKPFPILFGRINISKTIEYKNIDEHFLKGFESD